jgi:hypothetical protein
MKKQIINSAISQDSENSNEKQEDFNTVETFYNDDGSIEIIKSNTCMLDDDDSNRQNKATVSLTIEEIQEIESAQFILEDSDIDSNED